MVLAEALPGTRARIQPDKVIYYPQRGPIEILPVDPQRQLMYNLGILNMQTQTVTEIPVSGLTFQKAEELRSDREDPLYSLSTCLGMQGFADLIYERGGKGLYLQLLEKLWREDFIPFKLQAWDYLTDVLSVGSPDESVKQQARTTAYPIASVYELNLRHSDSLAKILHEVGLNREANALDRMVLLMKNGKQSLHGYKHLRNFIVLTDILPPQASLPV